VDNQRGLGDVENRRLERTHAPRLPVLAARRVTLEDLGRDARRRGARRQGLDEEHLARGATRPRVAHLDLDENRGAPAGGVLDVVHPSVEDLHTTSGLGQLAREELHEGIRVEGDRQARQRGVGER
jgi:hypothetical protein